MIECSRVRYSYDGEVDALDGIDLAIAAGEFVCILGGNGSGKSTFARHLNALLTPDAGSVRVGGLDTSDPEFVYDIRSSVGMVFQNPDDQLVATLVEDDIAFGPENLGVPAAELSVRVKAALKEVGLVGYERRETHALSGGQKQRLAIAGALAMHPRVLVLDEASSMLDPRGRAGLMRVAREQNARGMTVIMVTHFMEEAAEADRVVVIDSGRVALDGTPDEVLTRAADLKRLNLELPPACQLSLALADRGVAVPTCVRSADLCRELVERVPGLADAETAAAPAATGAEAEEPVADASATAAPTDASTGVIHKLRKNTVSARFEGPKRANRQFLEIEEAPAAGQHESAPTGATAVAAEVEATRPAHPILELEHVSYSYQPTTRERARRRRKHTVRPGEKPKWGSDPDAVWALRDVNLTIAKGEMLGIAGHTGSGKSTLVQHLNGLVTPTVGRVLLQGEDLAARKVAARAKGRVGVVSQYPERQLFAATVREDVAFGPRNLGLSRAEVEERVRTSLAQVSLDDPRLLGMSPFELSGGQQRRVAFAGVLAMKPEVLVLDEPTAGLDPASHREFLDLVEALHAQGLTVVMVSHNMDDLAEACDRIAVMNEGSVLLQGTPAEVFTQADALRNVGLGVPAAQAMARELADAGLPLATDRLYTVATLADELADILGGDSR